MRGTRLAVCAAAALVVMSGCARDHAETGPPGGETVSTPSAQPSPDQPAGSVSPAPPGNSASWAPASPTYPDAPALPVPHGRLKPSAGGTVTVTGTVSPGVEPNCMLLDGYLLVGGPRELFTSGATVTVTGRVEPGMMTTCQQGIPLLVESARRG